MPRRKTGARATRASASGVQRTSPEAAVHRRAGPAAHGSRLHAARASITAVTIVRRQKAHAPARIGHVEPEDGARSPRAARQAIRATSIARMRDQERQDTREVPPGEEPAIEPPRAPARGATGRRSTNSAPTTNQAAPPPLHAPRAETAPGEGEAAEPVDDPVGDVGPGGLTVARVPGGHRRPHPSPATGGRPEAGVKGRPGEMPQRLRTSARSAGVTVAWPWPRA